LTPPSITRKARRRSRIASRNIGMRKYWSSMKMYCSAFSIELSHVSAIAFSRNGSGSVAVTSEFTWTALA
jgi:hypothetical protein